MKSNLPAHLTAFNTFMADSYHLDWRESRVSRQYVPISIYRGVTATLTPMTIFQIKEKWSELCGIHTDNLRIKVFTETDQVVIYHSASVSNVTLTAGHIEWTMKS